MSVPTTIRPVLKSIVIGIALCSASVPIAAQSSNDPAAKITTQLPLGITPSHYAIRITPDATNLRFSAEARITITVSQPTQAITLNAADLDIRSATLTQPGTKQAWTGTVTLDPTAQTAIVTFPKKLTPGRYSLSFAYDGVINTQANGLFALDYLDSSGTNKRALFTQFEAPDARRFVPSWDEPSYKATFDLSVVVPKGQIAVSNMPVRSRRPLRGGASLTSFQTSPKMSSYLLFLGMGELDRATRRVAGTEVGVVTGKGNTGRAQLALDASAAILPWFNDYFGVRYPLPKLDNVAGPGQSQFFSAMENWGAIFTFERAMLVDPKSTSEATRRRVYEIVAHEMAHQWFGNLVTMAWWDDLWLNEGFASWMATKVTDKLQPQWEMLLNRVDGRESAMGLDAFTTTHPVVQHVRTVEEVSQAFDAITYEKGEAVIAMLESFAGETIWRNGIRAYMKSHAYGNTRTSDLWDAVEAAGAKGLNSIAHDFTMQPGIPLVKVEDATCTNGMTRLVLTQGEFSRDAKEAKDAAPLRWNVPIRATTLGGAQSKLILNGKGTITLPGCGAYLINAGQAGYYRSLYPEANITALTKNFGALASIDQIGLLADNWQLGIGGYQPIARSLDLVDAVSPIASDAILAALPDYWNATSSIFEGDDAARGKVLAHATARLSPILQRIGYDAKPGEGPQVPLLRQNLISTLGMMGDSVVVTEARRRYAAFSSDAAALDGPLKFIWLAVVARHADQTTWNELRVRANKTTNALERQQYFTLLGRPLDAGLASQALDLAMTDEPGKTTGAAIIAAVAGEHAMMAVDYVLTRKDQYDAMIDASARNQALARLGGSSADPAMAEKLDDYATKYLTPESRKVIDRSITAIRARYVTRTRLRPEILAWLDQKH